MFPIQAVVEMARLRVAQNQLLKQRFLFALRWKLNHMLRCFVKYTNKQTTVWFDHALKLISNWRHDLCLF